MMSLNTRFAGCFFLESRIMVRRYSFEIILLVMIICGVITASFWL
ncbi:small membrane protein YdgU [Erwinia oleae]|nr:hypothetical protein [Erwinia oleae]